MNVQDLARSMNVSESDVMALAQSVANSMINDGLSADHANNAEVVEAYVIHANKKMQSFVNKYLTNDDAKKGLQLSVLSDLKEF